MNSSVSLVLKNVKSWAHTGKKYWLSLVIPVLQIVRKLQTTMSSCTGFLVHIIDSMGKSLGEFRKLVMDREAWRAAIHGFAKSWTRLSGWIELNQVKEGCLRNPFLLGPVRWSKDINNGSPCFGKYKPCWLEALPLRYSWVYNVMCEVTSHQWCLLVIPFP